MEICSYMDWFSFSSLVFIFMIYGGSSSSGGWCRWESVQREPGKKKNNCLRVLFIRVSSYTAPKSPTSPALQSVLLSRCWLLGVEFGTGPEISLRKSQCNPKAKLHKSARVSRFPTGNFHPPRMKESQTPSAFHPLQICCFLNPILPNMHPMFVRSR